MLGEDVLYLSVSELAERIRTRKLSPVELAESYLERSRQLGPRLAAYATLTEDLARQQARQAEQEIAAGKYRGPLHGVPYAAKDLLAVRGYPTTWGATVFADQRFDYDATVISRLREAGAVLLGKAAMIELAGGMGYRFASASHTGPARNPWNHERLLQWLSSHRCRRAGCLRCWLGNLGLDCLSLRIHWHQRPAAHLWTRRTRRRHGAFLFAR